MEREVTAVEEVACAEGGRGTMVSVSGPEALPAPQVLDPEEERLTLHVLQMMEDIRLGPARQRQFWEGVVTSAHFHNEDQAPLYLRWLIRRGKLPELWNACVRSWELDEQSLQLLREHVSEEAWEAMLPDLAWMACNRQLLVRTETREEILSGAAYRFLSRWGYASRERLARGEWQQLRAAYEANTPVVQETAAGLAESWQGDPHELLEAAREICAGAGAMVDGSGQPAGSDHSG